MNEKRLIPAPIDNKNLMEDAFDELLQGFYDAPDHYEDGARHRVGLLRLKDNNGYLIAEVYVGFKYKFGNSHILISMLGFNADINYLEESRQEMYDYYERYFRQWECDENPGLRIKVSVIRDMLVVGFLFEVD